MEARFTILADITRPRKDKESGEDIPDSDTRSLLLLNAETNAQLWIRNIPLDAKPGIPGFSVLVRHEGLSGVRPGKPYQNSRGEYVTVQEQSFLGSKIAVGLGTTQQPPEPIAVF